MKDENGQRLWRDVTGVWGEAQKKLHIEATTLEEETKVLVEQVEGKRAQRALASCLNHLREAIGRLTVGHVPQAAVELVVACAWWEMAHMKDEDHAAATDAAEKRRWCDPGPLVWAFRVAAGHVLGAPCAARGCATPGHTQEKGGRCLGPRDGLHPILAVVDRPACARPPYRAADIDALVYAWRGPR